MNAPVRKNKPNYYQEESYCADGKAPNRDSVAGVLGITKVFSYPGAHNRSRFKI